MDHPPSVYSDLIPLKVDLQFYGLPLPSYVYSLMTAAYLDMNSNPYCLPEVGTNGATISQGNGVVNFFTHSVHDRKVTLLSLSPTNKTHEAWMGQLKSLNQLVAELKSDWKAVRYETVFYCSHCLLMRRASPAMRVNPDWGKPSTANAEESVMCYTGEENFLCKNDPDRQPVPNPLMFPCEYVAYFWAASLIRHQCKKTEKKHWFTQADGFLTSRTLLEMRYRNNDSDTVMK